MLRNKLVVNQPSKCHNKLNLVRLGRGGGLYQREYFLGLQVTDGAITGRAYTVSRGLISCSLLYAGETYNCKIHTKQLC